MKKSIVGMLVVSFFGFSIGVLNFSMVKASIAPQQGKVLALQNNQSSPAAPFKIILPANGKIVQEFRTGHYALDIAGSAGTPVLAAHEGTVTKIIDRCPVISSSSEDRGCGNGYGNHVVIDHGN